MCCFMSISGYFTAAFDLLLNWTSAQIMKNAEGDDKASSPQTSPSPDAGVWGNTQKFFYFHMAVREF